MKSHELAKLLLKLPDSDLFYTFNEHIGHTNIDKCELVSNILHKTPSGLFLTPDRTCSEEILLPSQMPYKGTMRIHFIGGDITTSSNVVMLPDDNSCFAQFNQYPDPDIILVASEQYYSIENDGLRNHFEQKGAIEYKIDDIDYIEVLTEIDKDTWNVKHTQMSYKEALQYQEELIKELTGAK